MSTASSNRFLNHLATDRAVPDPLSTLLIYDRKLARLSPEFRRWKTRYPHRYAVTSGEKLKDLAAFPDHVSKLARVARTLTPRTMTVLAVGGGSVGDFAGFFASIYKRGVRLVHMPSTWLAAIDSSHGGKTALNILGAKNQLGTFYPAAQVLLVRSLLARQPMERVRDAMGELGKIALIDGGRWTTRLEKTDRRGEDLLWEFLKPAIESKMKVVARDPLEQDGHRQILNLGHTVGHVFETAWGLSHGHAVAQGLFFALTMGEHQGWASPAVTTRARSLLINKLNLSMEKARPLKAARFRQLLLQDKKKSSVHEVIFIVLRGWGRVERSPVSVEVLLQEARRQGWVQ